MPAEVREAYNSILEEGFARIGCIPRDVTSDILSQFTDQRWAAIKELKVKNTVNPIVIRGR
jgi:hypothetical protein